MKIFIGKPLHIYFECSKSDSIIDINNKFRIYKIVEVYDVDIVLTLIM
jgi:hypothetical protein